ncbi:tumor necrosis factor receptor superfamily member 17 isoform X1 [Trichomycterus rosablanca]|uniref:tumor necrosis factor receptor superfamily member 17 isoform X1 n=1 Tax=Trichomycterus rosablanca TaxID=2290929 RepID=UPI002F3525C9
MILLFCLLLNVAPIAEGKCALNFYYDGLLDDCQPCSVRCKSPPTVCATYCKPTTSSINEAGEKNNVRVILIVLFVFFGACITLTLILQVMRRKTCKPLIKTKAQPQETSESERGSETTEQSDDGSPDMEEGTCKTHCNTSLPLPSTEEGTTMLVTTKTVQTYNCSTHYTEDVTFDVRRGAMV